MLKESESQFAQFFIGMIPVSMDGKLDKPTAQRVILVYKPAAFTKLTSLLSVYSKTAHQRSEPSRRRGVRFVNGHIT